MSGTVLCAFDVLLFSQYFYKIGTIISPFLGGGSLSYLCWGQWDFFLIHNILPHSTDSGSN